MIRNITKASSTWYTDNSQTRACVWWEDYNGCSGTTEGLADNTHMLSLLARARREGVKVEQYSLPPMPTLKEFIAGYPLRYRVLGTHSEFAVAQFVRGGYRDAVGYVILRPENSNARSRQPIMSEAEAAAFYQNCLDLP